MQTMCRKIFLRVALVAVTLFGDLFADPVSIESTGGSSSKLSLASMVPFYFLVMVARVSLRTCRLSRQTLMQSFQVE